MVINKWLVINSTQIKSNVEPGLQAVLPGQEALSPEIIYTAMQCSYPKFYKMDKLCKWAWVATEYLFGENKELYKDIDKNRIGLCLTTSHGCLDVDKRYLDGIALPSPALFVYTLPNIMLGELCIRHGFKGEQQCMVSEKFDAEELFFTVNGLLERGMKACLCGWVDVFGEQYDICLFWVTKKGKGYNFTADMMQGLYAAKGS